jgi:hypothetical protein
MEQLLIPNVHSSISTHEPEDVSRYPAVQTQMEESAPVILQIEPLPQLQSLTAVVVNCILAAVEAEEEIVEIICGVIVVSNWDEAIDAGCVVAVIIPCDNALVVNVKTIVVAGCDPVVLGIVYAGVVTGCGVEPLEIDNDGCCEPVVFVSCVEVEAVCGGDELICWVAPADVDCCVPAVFVSCVAVEAVCCGDELICWVAPADVDCCEPAVFVSCVAVEAVGCELELVWVAEPIVAGVAVISVAGVSVLWVAEAATVDVSWLIEELEDSIFIVEVDIIVELIVVVAKSHDPDIEFSTYPPVMLHVQLYPPGIFKQIILGATHVELARVKQ